MQETGTEAFNPSAGACESVRRFVRAPLDGEGLRRAWFLPMGSHEDGSFDFYAPMAMNPTDRHSHAFYKSEGGRLTHYLLFPDYGSAIAKCLSAEQGFERVALESQEKFLHASFTDQHSKRRIEIRATNDLLSLLIASSEWKGDVDEKMRYRVE